MARSHRQNAHFSRAKWKRWVVVPCWAFQMTIQAGLVGLFSYRLSQTIMAWEDDANGGGIPLVEFIWEIANIALSTISFLVTVVCIARFITEVLTPLPLLFSSILNLTLASAVLGLDIVIYVRRDDMIYSVIGLALDSALIIFTVIPLIYAIFVHRRLIKYDDYHLPGNHKAFRFTGGEDDVESRLTRRSKQRPPNVGAETSTKPTDNPQRGGRDISFSSLALPLTPSLTVDKSTQSLPQPNVAPQEPQPQRLSYDHKRDTMFEAYVARRLSGNQGHNHNRIPGRHDSGKSHEAGPSRGDSRGYRKAEVVGVGEEYGLRMLPLTDFGPRFNARSEISADYAAYSAQQKQQIQRTSRIPVISFTPAEMTLHRGHSLNSVPEVGEEEEEDLESEDWKGRRHTYSSSRDRLLGLSGGGDHARIEGMEGLEVVTLEDMSRRGIHDSKDAR
ncbi:hypothetical protein GGR50DRAFT_465365 [Xylaria sp. CBS 124048]|nr:hypothetical protein GGR50DRAFT_465365 [Xylaria sp. CBS 124048]